LPEFRTPLELHGTPAASKHRDVIPGTRVRALTKDLLMLLLGLLMLVFAGVLMLELM
jgi:hypothetical protein